MPRSLEGLVLLNLSLYREADVLHRSSSLKRGELVPLDTQQTKNDENAKKKELRLRGHVVELEGSQ